MGLNELAFYVTGTRDWTEAFRVRGNFWRADYFCRYLGTTIRQDGHMSMLAGLDLAFWCTFCVLPEESITMCGVFSSAGWDSILSWLSAAKPDAARYV